MATDYTRYEASDPNTAPERLQALSDDPELWAILAANPSTYDSLLSWLYENGDDHVRATIAARGSAATESPTAVLGTFGSFGAVTQQIPSYQNVPGQGVAAQQVPAQATYYPPTAAPRSSNKGLWITLSILLFMILGAGAGAGVWAITKDDESHQDARHEDDDSGTSDGDDVAIDDADEDEDEDDSEDVKDDDDEDDEDDELDCDELDDLVVAAEDLLLYLPGLDDQSDFDDAVDVIEEFTDHSDEDIADFALDLIDFAEAIEDDEDAAYGEPWMDAIDVKTELTAYVDDMC